MVELHRLGSSLRTRPACDTWRLAQQSMSSLGITRVTDVTRMDRLGLPVFASVRPRGALLQVHAGKGVRPEDARVGAAMEAIEFAVAEPSATRWKCHDLSIADLVDQLGPGLGMRDLVPRLHAAFDESTRIPAVGCDNLVTGTSVLVPAELVFLPYAPPSCPPVFGWTGNGLASGNAVNEATLHGLLEVLERDTIAMRRARDESSWVNADSWPTPFRAMAQAWRASGIELAVRSLTNAWSLPCFEAVIYEANTEDVNLASGSGLHVDRSVAFSRAVCEAAQSRLSGIHGGREDITHFYAKYDDPDPVARRRAESELIAKKFERTRSIDFESIPTWRDDATSIDALLADVIERLVGTGLPAVYRHRFDIALDGLAVVKVIVPRCEDVEHNAWRIGQRLLDRITGAES